MFFTILLNILISMWVVFCIVIYGYHYIVEVLFDLPVTGQSPCTAHATLKQIIEKLLREALNLPQLERTEEHPAKPLDDSERTYEDLLATAILNKVVNNGQNQPSSSAGSVSSRVSSSSKYKNKEYYFGEETLDSKWKNTDLDTTSVSSLEEWIHSDSSAGSTKFVDKVSLTIQQRIEEVSPTDSENEEEDDSQYFKNNNSSLLDSDECNWYLQKRHFQGTHSPVPVPMLVPNPTTEAKVLIGDREVDDTSDLSDAASDYGEIEGPTALNSLLIESKTVIGGKNLINGEIRSGEDSDAESSADSGVKEGSRDLFEEDEKPKVNTSIDDENVEDASLLSVYSNTEKDTEYTEKYASLPRTITKSPEERIPKDSNENNGKQDKEFTGCYSKKEKEKWKNPVEMKNNPYTKENIEKRMRSSQTFGRDYYLRQASLPSGARKTEEIEPIAANVDETDAQRAIATIVDDDSEIVQRETSEEVSEITSDSDLSFVNCYDVENSKIFRKSSDGGEKEVRISVNTEGLLYISKDPDEDPTPLVENGFSKPEILYSSSVEEVPYSLALSPIEKETPKIEIRVNTTGLLFDPAVEKLAERDENFNVPSDIIPEVTPRTKTFPVAPKRSKFIEPENTPMIVTKKSDNTLIKKIYSDPKVRNFALINREQKIPIEESKNEKNAQKSPDVVTSTPKFQRIYSNGETPKTPKNIEVISFDLSDESLIQFEKLEKNQSSDSEVLSDNFSLEFSDIEPTPIQRQPSYKDPEITELKEKRLVASRLGEFSKSFPNLSKIYTPVKENENNNEFESKERNGRLPTLAENAESNRSFISVKDLKKRFERHENLSKAKPVHSLTARSISKPMREKLKSDDSDDGIYVIEGIVDSPELKNLEEEVIQTENVTKYYEVTEIIESKE